MTDQVVIALAACGVFVLWAVFDLLGRVFDADAYHILHPKRKCLGHNPQRASHRPDYALIARLESELGVGGEAGNDPGCPFCAQDEVMAGDGLSYTNYLQGCAGCAERYFRDTGGYFAMGTKGERR